MMGDTWVEMFGNATTNQTTLPNADSRRLVNSTGATPNSPPQASQVRINCSIARVIATYNSRASSFGVLCWFGIKPSIQKAKELGVHFGRKKLLSPQQITELHLKREQGTLIKILMKDFDLSKASVYRYLVRDTSVQSSNP
jgi:hypothetical protein